MNARPPYQQFRKNGQPSALDKKMAEKDRLSAAYKAAKRKQYEELKATAPPEWPELLAAIKTMTPEPGTGGAFCRWLKDQQWLLDAGKAHRFYALQLIDARINKILQYLGREPLDDPIFEDTVFQKCKRILEGYE
jgi:hypothetical protein